MVKNCIYQPVRRPAQHRTPTYLCSRRYHFVLPRLVFRY